MYTERRHAIDFHYMFVPSAVSNYTENPVSFLAIWSVCNKPPNHHKTSNKKIENWRVEIRGQETKQIDSQTRQGKCMGSTTHNLLQGKNKYRQKGNDE